MAKRYYWLKLPDGFFRQKAIKKLRKIAGGDTYTIIYLKMLLVAMKQDGRLYFEGVEATFYDELALDLDEEVENVRVTVMFLIQQDLIGDPDAFLLAYATNAPSIDEPSAGYIFTWDMLGNGQMLPILNYLGENGTHTEPL